MLNVIALIVLKERMGTTTLFEILQDIHALQEDLLIFERKYNILSETFYESYMQIEKAVRREPPFCDERDTV